MNRTHQERQPAPARNPPQDRSASGPGDRSGGERAMERHLVLPGDTVGDKRSIAGPGTKKVGDRLVRGRIDAVYELPGGGLEIVDFKTGAEVERPGIDQLRIYAAALALLGVMPQGPLRLTYAYLASERTESRSMPPLEAVATLTDLTDRLSRLTARSNRDHVPAGIGLPGDEPGPGSATRSLL